MDKKGIKLEFKTNPNDDKLIDMYSNGNFCMSMIDGCKTPEGEKAIEHMAEEMRKAIDKDLVERLTNAVNPKSTVDDYNDFLQFKDKNKGK